MFNRFVGAFQLCRFCQNHGFVNAKNTRKLICDILGNSYGFICEQLVEQFGLSFAICIVGNCVEYAFYIFSDRHLRNRVRRNEDTLRCRAYRERSHVPVVYRSAFRVDLNLLRELIQRFQLVILIINKLDVDKLVYKVSA
ncbi:hypothetical protein SDC9_143673 [bioreactor metagenome]|uniref:Uncharacterized protein n=1 Tax=bioreactor metagenome TaxID=1076179 RepID=A0A645E4P0_9ZZZZ